MPDAAKSSLARRYLRFEHCLCAFAKQQVGVADDAGTYGGGAVAATRAHRRSAVGEFNLAHGPQGFRSPGAVHRTGLDINRRNHVVTGGDVRGDLVDQIALAAAIPEMMMWIDDGTSGVENFLLVQGKPVDSRLRIKATFGGRQRACDHG